MGVVFSPEQVMYRQVPAEGEHAQAGRYLLDIIEKYHDELPALRGAMIYGSTTFGKANRRSDLDILAILDTTVRNDELRLLNELYLETYELFKTMPEPNMLTIGRTATVQSHQLDAAFLRHLRYTQDNRPEWAIGRPVDIIPGRSLDRVHALEVATQYCSYKERQFLGSQFKEGRDLKMMQRCFELPTALARKAVQAIAFDEANDSAQLGREELARRARVFLTSYIDDSGLVMRANNRLIELDHEYSQKLEDALNGTLAVNDYSSWLDHHQSESMDHARTLTTAWKALIEQIRS